MLKSIQFCGRYKSRKNSFSIEFIQIFIFHHSQLKSLNVPNFLKLSLLSIWSVCHRYFFNKFNCCCEVCCQNFRECFWTTNFVFRIELSTLTSFILVCLPRCYCIGQEWVPMRVTTLLAFDTMAIQHQITTSFLCCKARETPANRFVATRGIFKTLLIITQPKKCSILKF